LRWWDGRWDGKLMRCDGRYEMVDMIVDEMVRWERMRNKNIIYQISSLSTE